MSRSRGQKRLLLRAEQKKWPAMRSSASRARSGRPHSARLTSFVLFPAAQFPDLGDGLSRKHDRITLTADSDENVRERYSGPVHANVSRLITCVHLLSANTACCRCYVAFMPWCLHKYLAFDSALLICPFCTVGHNDTTEGLRVSVEIPRFYESITHRG